MPVYEYKCKSCGEQFEIRRSLQEQEKEPECPSCWTRNTQRVFSIFSSSSSASPCAPAPSRFKFG
ncbi:MAG: zinc ribbon domain-containing protein [Dehalococcoidales bacterium]|nr:zinc ribbon domain-containing protein [Dehalococcoidales bacterium]